MNLPDHARTLGLQPIGDDRPLARVTVGVLDGGVADIAAFAGRLTRVTSAGDPDNSRPTQHATRCASLIASAHVDAPGLAASAHILSINVSTRGAVDSAKVVSALALLSARGVPVASCGFVIERLDSPLLEAALRYLDAGFVLVGASGNAPERRAFPFVRELSGATRVFADVVAADDESKADQVCAPGTSLAVVGRKGQIDTAWAGQSSGASALIAGVAARWLGLGHSGPDVRRRLRARFG